METYEKMQEALSLIKIVESGRRQVKEGKVKNIDAAFDELDLQIKKFKEKIRPLG